MSDTAFVAYFVDKEYYDVVTGSNNEEWGTVDGGGVYMEGEDATLTVTTAPFCIFEGWTDGEWQLPRVVTVTQDTMFTATFSFDSAWAAGIGQAGDLDFGVSPNEVQRGSDGGGYERIACRTIPAGSTQQRETGNKDDSEEIRRTESGERRAENGERKN